MENYAYASYPDSGESSPRSREVDFENPPPWEEQQANSYKVKFMCSYGGKIHPRPHDNQLSYVGGETKILAVDRSTKFSIMISKLAALCGDSDVSFKYQLPGEDLDALISVTNDDDLEHMMHEYDRLFRASAKPARMRLFLFPVNPSPAASFGSDGGKSDRDRFVEALNSGPSNLADNPKTAPNNVDFLFGLEKGAPPPPMQVKVPELPEVHVGSGQDDRVIGSDHMGVQAQFHRMHIREQEQQAMYRNKSDENLGGYGGDYYVHKMPDKVVSAPVSMPPAVNAPAGYWHEKQIPVGGYPGTVTVTTTPGQPDQVYMIQTPAPVPAPAQATVYHTPVMRPVPGQTGQGYYMQRMGGPEVYREQPVYNMVPQQQQQQQQQPPPQPPISAPTGPMGMMRPSGPGVGVTETGYTQVAYDNAMGRQVYYAAAPGGGVVQTSAPYQAVGGMGASGEMRAVGGGVLGAEGKVVSKASQGSV
ncbi:hypothetical protein K2173_023855 [Erythroxylum novogranatense]|uniref:PB1 domain-containing protein n=1 Tax=Erythroxylum novogranatense TaxID=1862640 RepID=A0AAV8TRI1_9ROSI|nr:hypothetical protein K2173_023855 [Erythroxylum novogranatense]